MSACNKLPGHADIRNLNPGKDPDEDLQYEDNSALGANSEQSSHTNRHETICISGLCENNSCIFLLDSGATHNFVSLDFIKEYKLQHLLKSDYGSITFGNESQSQSSYYVDLNIKLGTNYSSPIRAYTGIKSAKHNIILGKPWHYDNEPVINWKTHTIVVEGEEISTRENTTYHWVQPEVQFISRRQFNRMQRQDELEAYVIVLKDCMEDNKDMDQDLCVHQSRRLHERGGGQAKEKITRVMENNNSEALIKTVDSYYDVFPEELPDGLPPQRHVDHSIPIESNAKVPAQKLYRLSSHELGELKKQLNELISKGWIQPSKLPYGAPLLQYYLLLKRKVVYEW